MYIFWGVLYIIGAILVGFFIALNSDLQFCKWQDLHKVSFEDPLVSFVLFLWPLYLIMLLILAILQIPYRTLHTRIKVWQKKNKNLTKS